MTKAKLKSPKTVSRDLVWIILVNRFTYKKDINWFYISYDDLFKHSLIDGLVNQSPTDDHLLPDQIKVYNPNTNKLVAFNINVLLDKAQAITESDYRGDIIRYYGADSGSVSYVMSVRASKNDCIAQQEEDELIYKL